MTTPLSGCQSKLGNYRQPTILDSNLGRVDNSALKHLMHAARSNLFAPGMRFRWPPILNELSIEPHRRAALYICLLLAVGQLVLAGCGTVKERGDSGQAIAVTIPNGSLDTLSTFSNTRHVTDFYVLLTNVSNKPVRVWQEWCSWGCYNLQFEIVEKNGTRHLVTRKPPIGWTINFPDAVKLAPNESVVWRVGLWPSDWKGLSWLPTNEVAPVKLRAIYTVKPANDEASRLMGVNRTDVWTGRVTSKFYDFVLTSQATKDNLLRSNTNDLPPGVSSQ